MPAASAVLPKDPTLIPSAGLAQQLQLGHPQPFSSAGFNREAGQLSPGRAGDSWHTVNLQRFPWHLWACECLFLGGARSL